MSWKNFSYLRDISRNWHRQQSCKLHLVRFNLNKINVVSLQYENLGRLLCTVCYSQLPLKLNQQKQFEYDLMHERTTSFADVSKKLQHLKRNAYSANISNDKMDLLWYCTTCRNISFTPCSSGTVPCISSNQSVQKLSP